MIITENMKSVFLIIDIYEIGIQSKKMKGIALRKKLNIERCVLH